MIGLSPTHARPPTVSLSDRAELAIGISAMAAFVLFGAVTRAGWIDASVGLGGSALALAIYVAALLRTHLDGGSPRIPEVTGQRRFPDDKNGPEETTS